MIKRYQAPVIANTDFVLASDHDKLEAACREEHGGKYWHPECPICIALDGPRPTPNSGEAKP